ncbi:MAG: hypothetical protein U0269_32070 [Polyangiales bacterium]
MSTRTVLALAVSALLALFAACQQSALPASDGTTTTQASSGSEPATQPSEDAGATD